MQEYRREENSVRGISSLPSSWVARISHLGIRFRNIKLADQFGEAFRHPLAHDVVVHGPQLMADSRPDFGVEAALLAGTRSLAGLRLYFLHDLFHVSPRVKSLQLQEFFLISRPFPWRGSMRTSPKSSGTEGTFIRLGSNQARSGEPGLTPVEVSLAQTMNGVGMSRSQLVAEHLPLLRRYARP